MDDCRNTVLDLIYECLEKVYNLVSHFLKENYPGILLELIDVKSLIWNKDGLTLEERISTLEKHDKWQYGELTKISNCVEEIKKNMVSKEIDDTRWKLLDFCSALTSGRKYNREAFAHIFKTYEKYEQILEDNGMTNGFAEESMNAVKEIYHDKLKNGEFNN